MKLYTRLAQYYFAIEMNHRNIHHDIAFISSLAGPKKNQSILDLGCGTGEHLSELSKEGFRCTGIDDSPDMIKIARQRFPANITFLKKNMTSVDFYEDYDIVMSLFGSFNYLIEDGDIETALWNIWRALKTDGTGLLEVWNTVPVERIGEKGITHVSTTTYQDTIIERNRGFTLLNKPKKTVVEVNYKYLITDGEGTESIFDKHIMRTFSPGEIENFLKTCDFTVKNIYSNFLREPYRENSNRMIITFAKS